ncbi:MAG: EF-P lysine aminoacylase GenX [Planctomycetaceae bacterium]|jgi:lysyl-tRNA synthetase class 2|nr:EF-P lysine aminoacylase GenX [Planctomycetaceae bacterium]
MNEDFDFVNTLSTVSRLQRRCQVIRQIRQFFDARDFCEVQTPVLSADTVVDRHVEPIAVCNETLPVNHHGSRTYYLQTSPEFAMKRLIAAGVTHIYQIAPVFRSGDRGSQHNPEFTMLEWYRTGDDYQAGMNLLADLVQALGFPLPKFCTYQELFGKQFGVNPHAAVNAQLQACAEKYGIVYPDSYRSEFPAESAADAWLDLLFSEIIQPQLDGIIVYDYPVSQAQLAKTRHQDFGEVSERFELYLNGIEIANGYHELCDADELQRRFDRNNKQRLADGKTALPENSWLLEAMNAGLPPCSGTALGIERLLMVLFGAKDISEVMPFTIETA